MRLFAFAFLSAFRFVHAQDSPQSFLPFESGDSAAGSTIVLRHKVKWDRKSGAVEWKKLELESEGAAKLALAPGSYDPGSKREQAIKWDLAVRDGTAKGSYTPRPDGTYRADISVDLSQRDIKWKNPAISIAGISLKADLAADSRATSGALASLQTLNIRELRIEAIEAGVYTAATIKGRGSWNDPEWKIDDFEADLFGGHLAGHGEGTWRPGVSQRVAMRLRGDGIDLRGLLEKFNSPYAKDVEANLGGTLAVDVTGRDWRTMEFDLYGDQGTAKMSRRLLFEILAPSFGGGLERKEVEEVLNATFGTSEMIPFDQMQITGGLEGDSLALKLPLHNSALKLDVEPRIEEALLWQVWDWMVEQGLNNTKGGDVTEKKIERQK